jgi:hypothetical protein
MAARLVDKGWLVVAAISFTIAITSCGSSSNPSGAQTGTGSGLSASLVRFSACMRSHGVPGFPDPSTTQGPNSMGIDGYDFNLPAGVSLQSPAAETANKTCGHMIGGGGGHPLSPAAVAKARQAAIAHAECMRRHGVPNFPDPTFHGSAQGITVGSGGAGIDPRSPAFQHAQKACGTT